MCLEKGRSCGLFFGLPQSRATALQLSGSMSPHRDPLAGAGMPLGDQKTSAANGKPHQDLERRCRCWRGQAADGRHDQPRLGGSPPVEGRQRRWSRWNKPRRPVGHRRAWSRPQPLRIACRYGRQHLRSARKYLLGVAPVDRAGLQQHTRSSPRWQSTRPPLWWSGQAAS